MKKIRIPNKGNFYLFSWRELCNKFGDSYDREMRLADRQVAEELYDEYGLELLGYAVDPEDLYLLNPDTDYDTREAISPYCVRRQFRKYI